MIIFKENGSDCKGFDMRDLSGHGVGLNESELSICIEKYNLFMKYVHYERIECIRE